MLVFISYKRSAVPDDALANAIYEALRPEHEVFLDQKSVGIGVKWAQRIDDQIRRADFFIALLSEASVQSEMVIAEIEKSRNVAYEREGKPYILPVRVNFEAPFLYPLNEYLDHINWTSWQVPTDTDRVIKALRDAIVSGAIDQPASPPAAPVSVERGAPTPVAQMETVGGTMSPDSRFYIRRRVDGHGETILMQESFTLVIKGPRQVGKSSLLNRLRMLAEAKGSEVVFVDFERFSKPILQDSDRFFRQFIYTVATKLKLPLARIDDYWKMDVDNPFRTSEFMEDVVLPQAQSPLILTMDEVDNIFPAPFRSDFFGMLRSWHNSRGSSPLWKKLSLALVTSTEPNRFIEDLTQSPFNVAETLEPDDFDLDQVIHLARLHDLSPNVAQLLMPVLNGHPYLTRKALYLLHTKRFDILQLLKEAASEKGPFADHLKYHLFRLHEYSDLIEPFIQVLRRNTCDDERALFRLEGTGLVRKTGHHQATPRCQLYSEFFQEHLHEVASVQH